MKVVIVAPICGSGESWKVAEPTDTSARVKNREVTLVIEGDGADGYHLVTSPVGCFTADTWHECVAEAKATAAEVFGVPLDRWE